MEGDEITKNNISPIATSIEKVTAKPHPGYHFVGWVIKDQGREVPVGSSVDFVPSKNKYGEFESQTYYANFEEDPDVTIYYRVKDNYGGTVSLSQETIAPVTGENTIQGSTAEAKSGFHFVRWENSKGDDKGTSEHLTPGKTDNRYVSETYYAVFAEDNPIEIKYVAKEGGSVSKASESVLPVSGNPKGSVATANNGYSFNR